MNVHRLGVRYCDRVDEVIFFSFLASRFWIDQVFDAESDVLCPQFLAGSEPKTVFDVKCPGRAVLVCLPSYPPGPARHRQADRCGRACRRCFVVISKLIGEMVNCGLNPTGSPAIATTTLSSSGVGTSRVAVATGCCGARLSAEVGVTSVPEGRVAPQPPKTTARHQGCRNHQ